MRRAIAHICLHKLLLVLIVFCFFNIIVMDEVLAAGPPGPPGGGGDPPCWPPPCVPIDGGMGFLLASGLAYGGKKAGEIMRATTK